MLSQFPARDPDELVTKEHLDRRLAELENRLTNRLLTVASLQLAVVGWFYAIVR